MRTPTFFIPHGGGPCFFMDGMGPPGTWDRMAAFLRGLSRTLASRPRAIVVVSAHWEAPAFTVNTAEQPPLLFDYYGFPPHTYELQYPVAGSPALAERTRRLLEAAGFPAATDSARGLDHGVFIPFLLIEPAADVPIVQLSLRAGLDPAEHLRAGAALAPLRDEGVLLVGSGMSYHNLRAMGSPSATVPSRAFDDWLTAAAEMPTAAARNEALTQWQAAPAARAAHPREEHLLPLMVAAGAGGADLGARVYNDEVLDFAVSAYRFG